MWIKKRSGLTFMYKECIFEIDKIVRYLLRTLAANLFPCKSHVWGTKLFLLLWLSKEFLRVLVQKLQELLICKLE